ncbi:MAG: O-antigen polysaccharide polymerase Wzy family protein [Candidatus Symbiothrix sp.]|jgi:oligosaccharide repeat unit polymerase|nr:O-antigen polysaccharide polymerase Wzy family protein [Candidatus Symbiothrix sp.]
MRLDKNQLLFLLLLIEAIVVYLLAPKVSNYGFNVFCAIQYILSCVLFFILKKKKNYLDFDVIFMITYFFALFFYPVFLFENDPTRFFMFNLEFNHDVISRATALSLLGMNAYIFGSFLCKQKGGRENVMQNVGKIPVTNLLMIVILSFLGYVVFGGYGQLAGEYSEEVQQGSSIAKYVFMFVPSFLYAAIIIGFYNLVIKNPNKFHFINLNKFLLFVVLSLFLLMLATGSRTIPLQILLIIAGLYTLFYKQLSFFKLIPLIFLGMIGMFFIGIMRDPNSSTGNFQLIDIFMDLVICNRNSFVAADYVDQNGLTWGRSMLGSFLAPIPFLQNIVCSLFGIETWTIASSMIITMFTFDGGEGFGLGTNIIADIYMSFGMIGVIVLMAALGYFINYLLYKSKSSIYALAGYAIMMSYSIFLVRAEFTFFLRVLIWTLCIINIAKLHRISYSFNLKKHLQN